MILPQIIVNLFPGLTGYNERDRITKEEHYTNYFECKRISIMQFKHLKIKNNSFSFFHLHKCDYLSKDTVSGWIQNLHAEGHRSA